MNISELKRAIQNGQTVFGTLIVSTSPHWPAHLKNSGLDFVFLDTEHIVLNRETLSWMCRAYGAVGLAPVVRVPSPDPYAACQALDGGAEGIVAPYVETVEQVQALRGAVKLKPIKGKRLERALQGDEELEEELREYIDDRNRNNLLLVNIESIPAIENLDTILAVPDLDGILVGPHDLSCSLGIPEQYEHPRFIEALRTIVHKTRECGLIAGIHFMNCGSVSLAAQWIEMGINLHIQHADIVYVTRGLSQELQAIRSAVGQESLGKSEAIIV
ncbi:MAG: aldolase/citrate lyase family protein [bacterium]